MMRNRVRAALIAASECVARLRARALRVAAAIVPSAPVRRAFRRAATGAVLLGLAGAGANGCDAEFQRVDADLGLFLHDPATYFIPDMRFSAPLDAAERGQAITLLVRVDRNFFHRDRLKFDVAADED